MKIQQRLNTIRVCITNRTYKQIARERCGELFNKHQYIETQQANTLTKHTSQHGHTCTPCLSELKSRYNFGFQHLCCAMFTRGLVFNKQLECRCVFAERAQSS